MRTDVVCLYRIFRSNGLGLGLGLGLGVVRRVPRRIYFSDRLCGALRILSTETQSNGAAAPLLPEPEPKPEPEPVDSENFG